MAGDTEDLISEVGFGIGKEQRKPLQKDEMGLVMKRLMPLGRGRRRIGR